MTRAARPGRTPGTLTTPTDQQPGAKASPGGVETLPVAVSAPDLSFGEAMERLESIVTQLEENEALGLEQALAIYEQGLALASDCRGRLGAAKLRLTEIVVAAGVCEPER